MAISPFKLAICLFLLLKTTPGGTSQNYNPPKIIPRHIGDNWEKISNIPTIKGRVYYSPEIGDDMLLRCQASYPITWNFTGFITPADVVKIQPPQRSLADNMYEIAVNFLFLDAAEFNELGSSVRISCEQVGNPERKDEIFVFVRGKSSFVPGKNTTVIDSTLIPCPTKDPSTAPTLHRRNSNGKEEQVRSSLITYHPIEGFRSSEVFSGVYVCRQGSDAMVINAVYGEYDVTPKMDTVRVFSDETLQLECASRTQQQPVRIIVDDVAIQAGNITVSQRDTNQRAIKEVSSRRPGTVGVKGKARCLEGTKTIRRTAALVKEWHFEFVPAPELFLDNYEGEVDCLSDASPRQVQTVRCRNPMDCHFMSHCLENATNCNFKKQKQFFANKETTCSVEDRGRECASVPYSHLNGIVQCTANGVIKQWDYFVSLEFLRYSNWMTAPKRELLRMDEVPPILYTNGTTKFVCVAVAYLFADSLSFEILFENGTSRILQHKPNDTQISNPGSENSRKIDEFNVLGVLEINLSLNTTGITCIAPWGNATGDMRTSRRFETRHRLMPELPGNVRGVIKRETFYTGEKNRRLTCFAKGEPQPVYHWYYKNEKVSTKFPELKTSVNSKGEGNLDFPDLSNAASKSYTGEYKCSAVNDVGSVEQKFFLDISDEPISGRSVIYIVSVVVILLVLAVVLAMLYVFMKKYNEAKELVRSLTDSEIDEFFKGRPELLADAGGNNVEVVDFLPYKSEFEIPLDDLEFDSSEKNLLGSGEFSYVVRGKVISKNKAVAVKISKTSADVTLFKSLLSEVKIMIYIGEHENVVALIGVSTAGIRNRAIHIATEICELGSLDVYLRKARPVFRNLINSNQEIDISLLDIQLEEQETTTLDLISFSAQIAKGMEYLAYKSIVHADLAARNVLLTKSKIAKISDFGLSKKLYECNNYVKKTKSPLPWRWMAIESLNSLTFSSSSDIWAYGVTLFEIFTLGDIPFPNEEWNKEFITRLTSGMRMGRPKYSNQEIYSQIMVCWENEPELRPGFAALRSFFEQMLEKYTFTHPGYKFQLGNKDNENSHVNGEDNKGKTNYAELIHNHGDFPTEQRQYANLPTNGIDENLELNSVQTYEESQPLYANVN